MSGLKVIQLSLLGIFWVTACTHKQQIPVLEVANPTDQERVNATVVVRRNIITSVLNEPLSGQAVVLKFANGDYLPTQTDDLDQDGVWDELAFICSFGPQEKIPLEIILLSPEQVPDFPVLTNVQLGISRYRDSAYVETNYEIRDTANHAMQYPPIYQMEGPAWENNLVAFRHYFDERNGKDIFGKLTEKMVLSHVGATASSYHEISDWGMDVLKVGNSLGAGALALISEDSLVRLGPTEFAHFKLLAEGPVRSILEIQNQGWVIGSDTLDVTERISIWSHQYAYSNEISISGNTAKYQLAVGMVNLLSDEFFSDSSQNHIYGATFDQQSDNKDHLGMAIIASKQDLNRFGEAPDEGIGVTDSYYLSLKLRPGIPVLTHFVAGWEKSDHRFTTKQGFADYLSDLMFNFDNPIILTKTTP